MTTDNKTLTDALTRFRCAGYDPTDGSGPIMVVDPEGPWVLAADVIGTGSDCEATPASPDAPKSGGDWFGDVLGSIGTVIPLADVQPGGRVRLGNGLPEAVAQALATVNEAANDARHAGNYKVANALVAARVTLSKQLLALSAQPSPGGQGVGMSADDFANMVEGEAGEYGEMLEDGGPYNGWMFSCEALIGFCGAIINGWGFELRAQQSALAARQPVGEPVVKSVGIDALAKLLEDEAAECEKAWVERADTYMSGRASGFLLAADHFRKIATSQRWSEFLSSPAQAVDLGTGIKAIASERERQLCMEGFSRDSDEQYREGELARAATAYVQLAAMDLQVGSRKHIASQEPPFFWPWAPEWWKPVDARHDLVRAGALIAAQIDLIDSQAVGK